jgi:hypothetical protein
LRVHAVVFIQQQISFVAPGSSWYKRQISCYCPS